MSPVVGLYVWLPSAKSNTNLELALDDLSQPPTFDNGVAVQFVLKGFGEGAGFSVSDMLSNGIFGYRRPYLLNN